MSPRLLIPASIFSTLEGHLRGAEPAEGGAFALLGSASGPDGARLYVRELVDQPDYAWRLQGRAQIAPSSRWTSEVLVKASNEGAGVAFIHSHPPGIGGRGFSTTDEWWHEAFVPPVLDILGDLPFVSAVYCGGRMDGAAWVGGRRRELARTTIIGSPLREVGPDAGSVEALLGADRQIQLWGRDGQAVLGRLVVGVVGAGGNGSAVAEQLVRLGVGRVILVDFDVVSASNVTRVYQVTLDDVGQLKVQVIGRGLRAIRGSAVDEFVGRVGDAAVVDALLGCDLVVGCTDRHAPRSTLNDIAYQHFMPVVDIGCRVGVRNGRTEGLLSEVRLLLPDSPCLWCMDAISPDAVRAEALPEAERDGLARDGYIRGMGEEPSIIPLTSITASLAVLHVLDLALGLLGWPSGRIILDMHQRRFFEPEDSIRSGCACRRRWGVGDHRVLSGASSGSPHASAVSP